MQKRQNKLQYLQKVAERTKEDVYIKTVKTRPTGSY